MHSQTMNRREIAALALSALLHLLVTLALQISDLSALLPQREERTMEVEVVAEPPKRPPVPQPPPPPPPPPPEPPPPPKIQPAPQPPLPVQRPQLQSAPLAEKSTAPRPSARPEPAMPTPGLSSDTGPFSHAAPAAGDLAQSAQDKVLAQVLRMWHFNAASLRGSNIVLSATLVVNRDGTLSGPMHKDAPWNPDAVIKGYSTLPDGTNRRMLETFLLALRMAQPLQLPPDDGKPWPRRMLLRFKPGDL
ncbi:energy transducer TonB [Magnetospirillum sp. 15-1]|uniref:energy transducer TonB n=1 Tax=Magnetospirillum sp. 15-1 TaxID=1979370 RepID=UPI000BBBB73C|nr:energy transducer TonB [Magnetospirillum sp. 15-1]